MLFKHTQPYGLRAKQGHSDDPRSNLINHDLFTYKLQINHTNDETQKELPEFGYHTTRYTALVPILETGLNPAGRPNRVPLASSSSSASASSARIESTEERRFLHLSPYTLSDPRCRAGVRKDQPVVIEADLRVAYATHGVQFSQTRAGVIQSEEGIPASCITSMREERTGITMYARLRSAFNPDGSVRKLSLIHI